MIVYQSENGYFYKLYKNNCDFYIRPYVVVVVDNNVNVVYRISLNDWALKSVKINFEFLLKYNQDLRIPDPINLTYKGMKTINNIIVVSSDTKLISSKFNINTIVNDINTNKQKVDFLINTFYGEKEFLNYFSA